MVKHVQYIGIIRAFCLPSGHLLSFSVPWGIEKNAGCGLLGATSIQTDTVTSYNGYNFSILNDLS